MSQFQDYLPTFKAYVEGDMDEDQWLDWLQENADGIQAHLGRLRFLRLKFDPDEHVPEVLDEFGVEYQLPNSRCATCGATLFDAIPKKTTRQEIIEFALGAVNHPGRETILREGWIHPGSYCPNGCTTILVNYGRDELWRKFDDDFKKTHICHVTVAGTPTLPNLSDYKIYIDGNIARTSPEDQKPDNGEYVRLKPGEHRIVIREREPNRPDRLESNTIHFSVPGRAYLHFEVGMVNDRLELKQI
jgi:hypothetical protein